MRGGLDPRMHPLGIRGYAPVFQPACCGRIVVTLSQAQGCIVHQTLIIKFPFLEHHLITSGGPQMINRIFILLTVTSLMREWCGIFWNKTPRHGVFSELSSQRLLDLKIYAC